MQEVMFYAVCDACENYRLVKPIFNIKLCYDCTQHFAEWLRYRKKIAKDVEKEVKPVK